MDFSEIAAAAGATAGGGDRRNGLVRRPASTARTCRRRSRRERPRDDSQRHEHQSDAGAPCGGGSAGSGRAPVVGCRWNVPSPLLRAIRIFDGIHQLRQCPFDADGARIEPLGGVQKVLKIGRYRRKVDAERQTGCRFELARSTPKYVWECGVLRQDEHDHLWSHRSRERSPGKKLAGRHITRRDPAHHSRLFKGGTNGIRNGRRPRRSLRILCVCWTGCAQLLTPQAGHQVPVLRRGLRAWRGPHLPARNGRAYSPG